MCGMSSGCPVWEVVQAAVAVMRGCVVGGVCRGVNLKKNELKSWLTSRPVNPGCHVLQQAKWHSLLYNVCNKAIPLANLLCWINNNLCIYLVCFNFHISFYYFLFYDAIMYINKVSNLEITVVLFPGVWISHIMHLWQDLFQHFHILTFVIFFVWKFLNWLVLFVRWCLVNFNGFAVIYFDFAADILSLWDTASM